MIVGFGMLCLVLGVKSVFSGIQSPLLTVGLLGIFVGVPLFISSKKKQAEQQL